MSHSMGDPAGLRGTICPVCDGTGRTERMHGTDAEGWPIEYDEECRRCGGWGEVEDDDTEDDVDATDDEGDSDG